MLRTACLVLGLLFFCPAAPSQTTTREAVGMGDLLAEIRHLRQDLQTAANAARKAQIVIYRVHTQQAVVARSTERLENTKAALDQLQAQKKYEVAQIQRWEGLKDRTQNDQERKQFEDTLSELRAQMETWGTQEQELQTQQIALEQDLRIQQAKMDRLLDELERLDNSLEIPSLQASRQ
jgi:hypothetical protein